MKYLALLVILFSLSFSNTFDDIQFAHKLKNGTVDGVKYVNKFGENPDIDAADGFLSIWGPKARYTQSTTANINRISSSNAGDTTQVIEILGLDSNFDEVTVYDTLSGQTVDTLTTNLRFIYRMKNIGSSDLVGTVYAYVDTSTVASGVPSVTANIRAQIINGNNQTLMAIYQVPRNYTAFVYVFDYSLSKKTVATASSVRMRVKDFGKASRITDISALSSVGTSTHSHDYFLPVVVQEKSLIEFTADASANNTGVSVSFCVVLVKN